MPESNGNSIEIGQSDQELVGSKKRTNYKKVGLITLLFLIVVAVIVVVVVFVTKDNGQPAPDNLQPTGKPLPPTPPKPDYLGFELSDYLSGHFSAARNNASWISSNELMYRDEDDNIVKYNAETQQKTVLAESSEELIRDALDYELSADGKYILLATKYERIFRHSAAAIYNIYNIETKQITPLTVDGQQVYFLLAKWAPIGNGLALVYNFNLFYLPTIGAKEQQITYDADGVIRYGVADWVYEEEVFSSKEAVWFSPDGKKLAYAKFDDTNVPVMHIPVYGIPGSLDYQYPRTFSLNYPKSGTPNPDASLLAVDLGNIPAGRESAVNASITIPDPMVGRADSDHIISAVGWQNNDTVMAIFMNRIQNMATIQLCPFNAPNTCKSLYTLQSKTGWLDLFKAPLAKKDGSEILLIASQQQGNAGGYRHVVKIKTDATATLTALTTGQYVVTNILNWDQERDLIFYTANTEKDPNQQFVYALKNEAGQKPQCLTCDILVDGVLQTYFSASLSPKGQYLMLATDGPSIPKTDLYSWNVENDVVKIKPQKSWESNPELHEFLRDKMGPTIKFDRIKLDSGYEATIRMQIPPNAILNGSVKYPMLVDVYGGPDSYAGTNRFSLDYGSYLASNASIVMVQINARGCGLRGDKIMHEVYRQLGTGEIEDQIDAAKKLSKLPYIDENRVGIWGWSYGGYAAGMSLAKDKQNVFKCAASVAPVTDWIYYDTIYTERYMDLPLNNTAGYDEGRLSTRWKDFRGKNYFLIHGTFDDNVHFQQSMALSRSLELNDVLFTQMSYVDENHAMYSVRRHLYHSLGRFFGSCFNLDQVF